jgi:hypothetical protein
MQRFETLINQHHSIRKLIKSITQESSAEKTSEILIKLRNEIDFHTYLEEVYVYPALENYHELKREIYSLWTEHERLRETIDSLLFSHQNEKLFRSHLKELTTIFEEHIHEEEHHTFPDARRLLGSSGIEKIENHLKTAIAQKGEAA